VKVRYDGVMDIYLSDQIYFDSFTVVASETSDDVRNTTFLVKRYKPGLVYGYEEAAKKYAEDYDCGEYSLLSGEEIEISVEPFDGGEKKSFELSGETEPVYYAKEIKKE
ncbi:unnamed protein product, partial [marine sediment metagenome]